MTATFFKGKGSVERKYVYQDRTLQAEKFDTSLIKIYWQMRKLLPTGHHF